MKPPSDVAPLSRSVRPGSTSSCLTSSQLAEIQFYSDAGITFLGPAGILADGEVVPVPEPSTWCSAALAAIAAVWGFRRRLATLSC